MKNVILKNEMKLTIRPAIKEDAVSMIEYLQKVAGESDNLTFGAGELDITVELEEKIIEESLNDPLTIFIIGEVDGIIASMLNFSSGRRLRTRHAGEFGITVRQDYWNIGIAKEMIKYMIQWAKKTTIIRKINLRVRSDNYTAMNLYKSMGFKEEGLITRDFIINGIFYDSISMGLFID